MLPLAMIHRNDSDSKVASAGVSVDSDSEQLNRGMRRHSDGVEVTVEL